MSDPGAVDLSADVDFAFLKEAISTGSGMKNMNPMFFVY